MPPARRSRTSSGPAARGAQKTISFGNKVTKPTSISAKDKVSLPKTLDVGHVSSEAAVAQQAAVEIERVKKDQSPEELKAEKVTDLQIKKYWREREKERRTPRVHQEGLSVEEKILRLFDMSSQYGVCLPVLVVM
jgi:DNA polymerase delta subunit 4